MIEWGAGVRGGGQILCRRHGVDCCIVRNQTIVREHVIKVKILMGDKVGKRWKSPSEKDIKCQPETCLSF